MDFFMRWGKGWGKNGEKSGEKPGLMGKLHFVLFTNCIQNRILKINYRFQSSEWNKCKRFSPLTVGDKTCYWGKP